jgi:low temperature requirement protein LtrA
MRNRWYHRPLLHSPALGVEKKATWLELFYDLIFVAAFIQLGNGLSHHLSPLGVFAFAGVFIPLWLAWSGYTFFVNRFTVDDFAHRSMVLLQMFAVGGMAISAPRVLDGDTFAFSLAAGVAQLLVAVMHLRTWRQVDEARDYSLYWGIIFLVASTLWFVAAMLPTPWCFVLWGLASAGALVSPAMKPARELTERYPLDFEHLGERYGLLTIIVLGESFVKVLSSLAAEKAGLLVYLDAGVVLLLTSGIWWVYFDDVAGSVVRKGPGKWIVWLLAHMPLQAAIVATGVAVKKAASFGWDAPAPAAYRWLLVGSLAVVYASVAAIDSVTERRQAEVSDRARVNMRWISALVLLVLAPAGRAMSGGMLLTLVAAINVSQVIFDMMTAPFAESEHAELGTRSLSEIARELKRGGEERRPRIRRDVTEAVRKGTPSELRRDLYYYFMEGSWTRVFVAFSFIFVIANVFFAGVYMLEPGSIGNTRDNSFADAFFFSVQTMSTIGYGAMSPATAYGDAIVSIQAATSIIGVAIVTGLVFAKASRPKASVLFSRPLCITEMHGEKVMLFRVGNARGNEVVDATIDVTVLKDELSVEGHHMRRLHELKLMRRRSQMFVLTWLVVHVIDDDSPLADVDWDDPGQIPILFIATLMGHDSTYGGTIYARHNYQPEDIGVDKRFVDVISELPDGRLMVDYNLFHETIDDEEAVKEHLASMGKVDTPKPAT